MSHKHDYNIIGILFVITCLLILIQQLNLLQIIFISQFPVSLLFDISFYLYIDETKKSLQRHWREFCYSTVTDLAKLRGLSISLPFKRAK